MKDTPIIKTSRLLLRPFSLLDAPRVYEWCSSFSVTKYLFWYPHRDINVTMRLLKNWLRKKRNYSWCIEYDHEAIGEVQVIKDLNGHGFEIGYILHEDYWQKGLMKEALNATISYLFTHTAYQYALAITDINNLPSRALLESLSFSLVEEESDKEYFIAKKGVTILIATYRLNREDFLDK